MYHNLYFYGNEITSGVLAPLHTKFMLLQRTNQIYSSYTNYTADEKKSKRNWLGRGRKCYHEVNYLYIYTHIF